MTVRACVLCAALEKKLNVMLANIVPCVGTKILIHVVDKFITFHKTLIGNMVQPKMV